MRSLSQSENFTTFASSLFSFGAFIFGFSFGCGESDTEPLSRG